MDDREELRLIDEIGGPSRDTLDRLIYVVGSARGGTTLTKNVIGLHDQVISFDGPSHFLNHVWRYRRKLHDRLWLQLLWSPGFLHRDKVRESLPEKRRQAYLRLINRAVARRDLRSLYRLYPLVRWLSPDQPARPKEPVAWLDKGNDFWGVDELPRNFPLGRFVFVVRDPRGAITSLAKRVADARADTRFVVERQDIVQSAIYWRNLVQQQLRFARRHSDQTILFRYEDLATEPVETTVALYDALGLPPYTPAKAKEKLDGVLYGASLDSKEQGTGVRKDPLVRWKTALDAEALDIVSTICRTTAQKLGYDVSAPKSAVSMLDVARLMPGWRNRLLTLAKLAYLNIREPRGPSCGDLALLQPAGVTAGD